MGDSLGEVVSCRVAMILTSHARRDGWAMERLLDGTDTTLAHLDDFHGWISYDQMARLCANAATLAGSPEALTAIGAETRWEMLGPFRRVLELLGNPGIAYALAPAWMVLTNRVATASVNLGTRGECVLWGSYCVSHPQKRLADLLVAGALSAVSTIFGLDPARVEILESRASGPRQVAFRIIYPRRPGTGATAAVLQRVVTQAGVLRALRTMLAEIDAELGRASGGRVLPPPPSPSRGDKLERLALFREHFDIAPLRAAGLTEREIEVAQHACVGMANKEVADVLGIGLATVKEHFSKIFSKMRVENRTELASVMLR